jgi:hypothetical protein
MKIILIGILAGIFSSILNDLEENYGFNHFASDCFITILIILIGYLLKKIAKAPQK